MLSPPPENTAVSTNTTIIDLYACRVNEKRKSNHILQFFSQTGCRRTLKTIYPA
jgi:hypothetical protein